MRVLEEILSQLGHQVALSQGPNLTRTGGDSGQEFYSWIANCHGFCLYLGLQARRSLPKLSRGRSYIMVDLSTYACPLARQLCSI